MKTSVRCPKCEGRKIWVIERYAIPERTSVNAEFPMCIVRGRGVPEPKWPRPRSFWDPPYYPEPHGIVDLYLCGVCGYVEFWGREFPDLIEDPDNGVRLLDATAERGAFR